jgi:hypothetical protein
MGNGLKANESGTSWECKGDGDKKQEKKDLLLTY